jgi:hypothetical protein
MKNIEFYDTTLTQAENITLALDNKGSAPVRKLSSVPVAHHCTQQPVS